jgi:hypothetical protein
MIGNEYGRKNGWFYYPTLFDPTWKEVDCANYEDKGVTDERGGVEVIPL